jgi:hypothetical protein
VRSQGSLRALQLQRDRYAMSHRFLRALLLAARVCLASAVAVTGHAAESARELHGMADAFATPGVALAWGVLRGESEAATIVVVRIAAAPDAYPWVSVVGNDPFTQAKKPLLLAIPSAGVVELRLPRAHFADFPRTEFRFHESAAAVKAEAPQVVVYFLGVPDTTPEFDSEDKLAASLDDRIARVRAASAGMKP